MYLPISIHFIQIAVRLVFIFINMLQRQQRRNVSIEFRRYRYKLQILDEKRTSNLLLVKMELVLKCEIKRS